MKHFEHRRASGGFTLLEVVIVMFIIALVLAAVHAIAQGTVTLADDVRRAQRHDARQQAFVTFVERLFASLGATTSLNMKTTQDGGQYLSFLELRRVPSPFDGAPDRTVTLFTEAAPGGGLRLMLGVRLKDDSHNTVKVLLFDNITTCEWRAFDAATRQWTTVWNEDTNETDSRIHPPLMELLITQGMENRRQVFWIAPNETTTP
jgi:prepilin-type N-terminal cleavage/methylation domain-containing protein